MKTAKAKKLVLPAKILLGACFVFTVVAMVLIMIALSADTSFDSASGTPIYHIPQMLISFYYIYQGLSAFGGYALFYFFFAFYILLLAAFILPHILIERIKNKVIPVAVCLIFSVLLIIDAVLVLRTGYSPVAAFTDFTALCCSVFLTVVILYERPKDENSRTNRPKNKHQ